MRFSQDFVFPEPEYAPSCLLELLIIALRTLDIALDFTLPVFLSGFGQGALTDRAAMPEASVYKDCDSQVVEDHIGRAWQIGRVFTPASNVQACEHSPQASLDSGGFALDRLHRTTAVGW